MMEIFMESSENQRLINIYYEKQKGLPYNPVPEKNNVRCCVFWQLPLYQRTTLDCSHSSTRRNINV